MQSFRAIPILTSVLACCTLVSNDQELQRECIYRPPASDVVALHELKWGGYRACQTCLLDVAGVSRVSLVLADRVFLRIRITSTIFGFQRMVTHCNGDVHCRSLELISQLPLEITNNINAMDHPTIRPVANAIGIEQPIHKTLCVIHDEKNADEECRTCLRQASGSIILGESFFANEGELYFTTILRTSRGKDEIIEVCEAYGACKNIRKDVYYSDQICDEIHDTKISTIFKRRTLREEDQRDSNSDLLCFVVKASTLVISTHKKLVNCMKCLGDDRNTIIHSFKADAELIEFGLLLVKTARLAEDLNKCQTFCHVRSSVPIEKCYDDYDKHFDMSPVGNQISLYMPKSIRNNVNINDDSGCVSVHHQSIWMSKDSLHRGQFLADEEARRNECIKCLQSQIGIHVSPLSDIRSLITLNAANQMRALGNCINDNGCNRLAFIPNEMCTKEVWSSIKKTTKKINRSHTNLSPYENEAGSSRQTSNSGSLPTQSERLIPVMMARYAEAYCLVCLALLYEVIMVSTVNKYVWVLRRENRNQNLPVCQSCLTDKKTKNLNIRSLRPISATQIQSYVHAEISMEGNDDGLIAIYQLPIVDPSRDTSQ